MPRQNSDQYRRKRRTREHVIEDLSRNFLERQILLRGHVLERPTVRDYGVDATMFHFAGNGELENGEVRFQLKATDSLNTIKRKTTISLPISMKDLHYWSAEVYPFILVVFDAKSERAFWLDVHEYVEHHRAALDPDQATVNVHISVANELTANSIEHFRRKSLQAVANFSRMGELPDAARKPK
jgi:hypothetical protein